MIEPSLRREGRPCGRRVASVAGLGSFLVLGILFLSPSSVLAAQAQEPPRKPESRPVVEEEEANWAEGIFLGLDPDFETGKYGTKRESSLLYVPLELGYDADPVVATVTVPYLLERNAGNILRIGNRTVFLGKSLRNNEVKTVGGMGDILADAGVYVLEGQRNTSPSIFIQSETKIPTADDDRNRDLGDGAYDETIYLTVAMTLVDHLKLSLETGYGILGKPEHFPNLKLHNLIYWTASIGWEWDHNHSKVYIRFEGNSTISRGSKPYELLAFEYSYSFKKHHRTFFSPGFGFTKASPDFTLTFGYEYDF